MKRFFKKKNRKAPFFTPKKTFSYRLLFLIFCCSFFKLLASTDVNKPYQKVELSGHLAHQSMANLKQVIRNQIVNFSADSSPLKENNWTNATGDICASISNTEIKGTVFEDWNYDGSMNQSDTIGVPGVQINLYDDCGSLSQTSYTDSDGNYQLTGLSDGTTYRVEFSLPDSIAVWAKPTRAGTDNGTSVQFVQAGDCASLGLASPADYCSEDLVFLGTSCYVKRESDGTFSNIDALVSFSNEMGGEAGDTAPNDFESTGIQTIALHHEVGSNFGLAYNRFTNELFSAAYMKYQADFGSGGPGAIYKTGVNPKTGEKTADPVLFTLLDTMPGISICADPHGSDLDDSFNAPFEAAAFNAVGKCSMGDMDISDDGSTLYVVNLTDKKIIAIQSQTGAFIESWDFPTTVSTCTGHPDDIRPFGLKYYRNFLYVGSVCSAESTQDQSDLHAFVHKLDVNTGAFLEVLDFPLDYLRVGNSGPESRFNFWVTSIEDIDQTGISSGGTLQHYQPMLSDIEFDGKKMIIGIRDRINDQWGGVDDSTLPPGADPSISANSTVSHGDILIAYDTGSDNWVLENNGTLANGDATAIQTSNSGPGGFEFFADGTQTHLEISDGGLAVITNTGQTILSAMNPPNVVGVSQSSTGGIVWMDNRDGTGQKGLILYSGGFQTFSKNNGVGDIEAYCSPAPIEIGNYVWEDTDGDGVQDACETPLEGVILTLYDNNCKVCAIDTTDALGQYYFNDAKLKAYTAEPTDTILKTNTIYHVVVTGTSTGTWNTHDSELALNGTVYNLTLPNQGANEAINSDATLGTACGALTNYPFITLTTGDAGHADHRTDIGFNAFACPPQICLPVKTRAKRGG